MSLVYACRLTRLSQVINQKLLRRQLEKALFQVGTANNGLEGDHYRATNTGHY